MLLLITDGNNGVGIPTAASKVWEALGGELVSVPIAAMVLHLSVGDTWNHINNVEKRLGVAVPVVFLVVSGLFYLTTCPTACILL